MNIAHDDKKWHLLLAAGMLAILGFLLLRNYGLHPFVFLDELAYSTYSRLVPRAEAIVPSWLYFWLFGATNACGPAFLECARGINAILFVASGPLIYQCARTVTGRRSAAAITFLSLLAPVNSYTAYFMPEATYYFMFWLVTWVLLTRTSMPWARHAVLVGVLVGLMATVKVHAVFLLPAVAVFMVFRQWQGGGRWVVPGFGSAALAVAVAVAVKYVVGCAIAGEAGLSLFGAMYGAHSSGSTGMLMQKLGDALLTSRGHLMGLVLPFAFPMAVALYQLCQRDARNAAPAQAKALHMYTLVALGAPLAMTILYTASIYSIEGTRVHSRYYDFALPLLCMMGAALVTGGGKAGRLLRWSLAGLLAVSVVVAALYLDKLYELSYIDGPELKAMHPAAVGAATLVLLALWASGRDGWARNGFVFIFLPLYTLHTLPDMRFFFRQMEKPSAFDSAGKFASATLAPDQRRQLVIAGTGLAHIMRAKFYLDEHEVTLVNLPENAPLEASAVPVRRKWVLVVGAHALPAGFEVVSRTAEYALLKQERAHRPVAVIGFGAAQGKGPQLARMEGLGDAEQWGRWSTGKEIILETRDPLPAALNLIITAQTFGPNNHKPVAVRVGGQERSFSAPATPQESLLQFDTDGQQKRIVITVPEPASPKALGLSPDDRTLGVGLISIEIGTRQ